MKNFFDDVCNMKRLLRQGWVTKVNGRVESIADHSFGVTVLALYILDLENDYRLKNHHELIDKALPLTKALLHDLPESTYHDLDHSTYALLGQDADNIRNRIEKKSIEALEKDAQAVNFSIEHYFASNTPPTDEIVLLADKLELILQVQDYVAHNQIPITFAKPFIISSLRAISQIKHIYTKETLCELLIEKQFRMME